MTMQKLYTLSTLLALFTLVSCTKEPSDSALPSPSNSNLKFFGFSLIDVFFDDPTDSEIKSNYGSEVKDFSNLADILVFDKNQDIVPNLELLHDFEMLAYLHLNELFFEIKEIGGEKSGVVYQLREDYEDRWSEFINVNDLHLNQKYIKAFYIGEEPFWNGISFEELQEVADLIKSKFPKVKLMLIEAYPALNELEIPNSVDWVGFDHYFIKDPSTDVTYQNEFNLLKSKMADHQEIIIVLDSHFLPLFHRLGGITKNNLDEVARNYYSLANSDEKIVGMIGYHWPSGFEFENATGARGLPDHVKNEYSKIGKAITRK
jgi:hypothetical protein